MSSSSLLEVSSENYHVEWDGTAVVKHNLKKNNDNESKGTNAVECHRNCITPSDKISILKDCRTHF